MASIVSWQWELDGAVVSTTQTCSVTPAAGTHTITLTVTDDAGDSASRSWTWTVHEAVRTITSYQWTIGNTSASGQVVSQQIDDPGQYNVGLRVRDSVGAEAYREITHLIKVSGDQVTFSWNFGDGTSSTGRQVEHRYTYGGNFVVTMRATDFWGRSVSVQTSITIQVYGIDASAVPLIGKAPLTVRFIPGLYLTGIDE